MNFGAEGRSKAHGDPLDMQEVALDFAAKRKPYSVQWRGVRRGTSAVPVDEAALDRLQALRDALGKPLTIRSARRSPAHNRAVGGAARSQRLLGIAFDMCMANHDPEAFEAVARIAGLTGFGFYPRSGFIHVDFGPAREWGERFAPRAAPFPVEPPEVP